MSALNLGALIREHFDAQHVRHTGHPLPEPHDVRVMAQVGPTGAAFWARCSCGWTHRGSYSTREQAQTVADEHTAGV